MATTIKLTSKRQATFPVELCEGLGIEPGDELELIPRVEGGERVWLLQKRGTPQRPWLGRLNAYAGKAADHSMDSVRESIRKGRARSK
jgi:bifunctional DNA-binding transcriptional regulator/antitoxin component of YhaV-PrlF toxin-antitoxin module